MTDLEMVMTVAEQIMGWRPVNGPGSMGGFWSEEKKRTQMVHDSLLHKARKKLDIDGDRPGDGFCFSPLLSVADAWQVVEKMPYKVTIQDAGGGDWSVSLWGGGFVTAPGIGRAICIAALDSLRIKRGQ